MSVKGFIKSLVLNTRVDREKCDRTIISFTIYRKAFRKGR